MQIKNNKTFNYDKETFLSIYLIFYFIYLVVSRIVPIAYLKTGICDLILSSFFAGVGILLIFVDILKKEKIFGNKSLIPLFLFLIVQLISSIMQIKYGLFSNLKVIIWSSIHYLILFTLVYRFDSYKLIKLVKFLFNIMTIIWLVCALISIGQFFLNIGYQAHGAENILKRQGFIENRLFGIFEDPNFASMTSLCIISFNSIMIKYSQDFKIKGFYVFSIIVQFIYIILSGSRTMAVCLLIQITIFFTFFIRNYYLKNNSKSHFIIIKSLVSILIVILVFLGIFYTSKNLLSFIPDTKITETSKTENIKEHENILKREDVKKNNVLNNRGIIWREYVNCLNKETLLFGMSPRNSLNYIEEHYPDSYLVKTKYSAHSDYIAVLAYTGIVGLFLILYFYIHLFIKVFKNFFSIKKLNGFYVMCSSIVAVITVYSFFFLDVFFSNSMITFIFWTLSGALMNGKDDLISCEDDC